MSIVEKLLDTAYQDTQLLVKNDSLGDNFSVPRDVDFYLITNNEQKANTVCSFINDNRYGLASVKHLDNDYTIHVVVRMPTEQNILCSVSALMACVGHLFGIEYDGWGCPIQKAN